MGSKCYGLDLERENGVGKLLDFNVKKRTVFSTPTNHLPKFLQKTYFVFLALVGVLVNAKIAGSVHLLLFVCILVGIRAGGGLLL